jgi:histone H3/H4
MGSHAHHTTPGMAHPHPGVTMQQQPMHYAQAQPQMLTDGGAGYGMVAPQQLQGQMQMQPQLHFQQLQKQQLQIFWQTQTAEMEQVNDFKNHQLPLARIKKIMKSDEDVKMIAAEAPVLFAKACEMFILELTLRSWIHTEENKRRTLQRNDIAGAITRGDIFDFLVDIVPRDELKEDDLGAPWNGVGGDANVPYGGMYYPAMGQPAMGHHQMTTPDMMVVQTSMAQNPQMMYQPPQ